MLPNGRVGPSWGVDMLGNSIATKPEKSLRLRQNPQRPLQALVGACPLKRLDRWWKIFNSSLAVIFSPIFFLSIPSIQNQPHRREKIACLTLCSQNRLDICECVGHPSSAGNAQPSNRDQKPESLLRSRQNLILPLLPED